MRGFRDLAISELLKRRPIARKLDTHLQLNRGLAFCNRNIFRLLHQQSPNASSLKSGCDGKLAEITAVGLFPYEDTADKSAIKEGCKAGFFLGLLPLIFCRQQTC